MTSVSSSSYASVPAVENASASRIPLTVVFAMLGIVGMILILIITPYGTALAHGDSVVYYSSARSFANGEGFRVVNGDIYSRWPPLYPTLIAGLMRLDLEGSHPVRIIDALAFGLTVFMSGQVFLLLLRSKLLALLGAVAVLIGWPLVLVAYFGLAECLFSLLTMVFLYCLLRYLREPTVKWILLLGVAAALGCLQRYLGVALVLAGGLTVLVFPGRATWIQRFRDAVVFGIISVAPLGLWFLRNLLTVGSVVGSDWEHKRNNMQMAPSIMLNWLWSEANVPIIDDLTTGVLITIGSMIVLGVIAVALRFWTRDRNGANRDRGTIAVAAIALVSVVNIVFFVAAVDRVQVDITERMFAPFFVPTLLLLFSIADSLSTGLDRWLPRRLGTVVVAGLIAFWLVRPVGRIVREVNTLSTTDAALGYNNLAWRQSELIGWLQVNLRDEQMYSNADYPVFVQTNRHVYRAGRDLDEWEDFGLSPGETFYYAWFSDVEQNGCNSNSAPCFDPDYDLDELETLFEVDPVVEMDAGTVYHLVKR